MFFVVRYDLKFCLALFLSSSGVLNLLSIATSGLILWCLVACSSHWPLLLHLSCLVAPSCHLVEFKGDCDLDVLFCEVGPAVKIQAMEWVVGGPQVWAEKDVVINKDVVIARGRGEGRVHGNG